MFKTRFISGIFLVIFLLVTIIPGGYNLAAATCVLALIAFRELLKACGLNGYIEIVGYIGIVAYYIAMVFGQDHMWLLMTVFAVLIVFMGVYVFTFPKYTAVEIMRSFFCFAYGPLMLGFVYLTRQLEYGAYIVWIIFAASWGCDTAAYCVGMLLGKHKLAPTLSPKKSIEGAIGGVAGAALLGGLFAYFVIRPYAGAQNATLPIIIISAIGAVISQIGDLAASGIKRNESIKDYGKLIPGHGGVMDRFDSVIFVAPVIYFLSLLMLGGLGK